MNICPRVCRVYWDLFWNEEIFQIQRTANWVGTQPQFLHFKSGGLKGHLSVWVTTGDSFLTCSECHSDHLSPQRKWRRRRERERCSLPAVRRKYVKVDRGNSQYCSHSNHVMSGFLNAFHKKKLICWTAQVSNWIILWTVHASKHFPLCINE